MIEIVDGGVLATVQDATGRAAWRHLGVRVGGAADAWSARLANRLVGNADEAAVVETAIGGLAGRFQADALISLTGGLLGSLDGMPINDASARLVRSGAVMRLAAGRGARGYLAVAGGVLVPPVLGSASTDLAARFGGHHGRALRAGDRLAIGNERGTPARWRGRQPATGPIRIVPGPHPRDGDSALIRAFRVGADADRVGVRLDPPLDIGDETTSMGLPLGAIQVPPDGRPIVMLADRPVTGGYRVPAVVIGADIGRVAQLLPGDEVSFARVSLEEARDAWRTMEDELAALDPLDEWRGDELGWVGSHE